MDKTSYVYILASHRNGTFYTGVTSDIVLRISQHRNGVFPGFTHDHRITALVWYEALPNVETAIAREKSIKRWRRSWKMALVEGMNPDLTDLWPTLFGDVAVMPLPRKPGPGSSPG